MRIHLRGFGFIVWEAPLVMMALAKKRIYGGRSSDYLPRVITIERDGLTWLWRPKTDDYLAFSSEHEPLVTDFITREFRCDEVFLDVGSHVGRYAVRASRKRMKVHAWEPNSYNRFGLMTNLRMNHVHATVHPEALGDTDGYVFFEDRRDWGGTSHVTQNGRTAVQVKRLDAYDIPEVHLIKIDTEGFEFPILRGARSTLKRDRPKVLLELHRPIVTDSKQKCMGLLQGIGYSEFTSIGEMGDEFLFCS
jgi:FkbM family methyltransferase